MNQDRAVAGHQHQHRDMGHMSFHQWLQTLIWNSLARGAGQHKPQACTWRGLVCGMNWV